MDEFQAQPRKAAPYVFYGQTTSLCATCHALVPAKIVIEDNKVYYLKRCREHGMEKALVSSDAAYYKLCFEYLKPGDRPLRPQTSTDFGCPYDCGLCPDHEQHSCLALLEVNETCNLSCPVCFADSSPQRTGSRSLVEIERMMDALVASEGEPDLLQLSGGEPTIHPDILEIIAMARRKPIRHLMLNTNGIRIAEDLAFVEELAKFKVGFEVYLQFDSLKPAALKHLRGADLTRIRRQALEALERHNISTTLVVVIKRGVNDDEIKTIIEYALQWRCVRGVTFQPVQDVGRNQGFDHKRDRYLLSDVRRGIIEANVGFGDGDIIPLPCNPESIAIGYALRNGQKITPVTSFLPREELIAAIPNAITFEKYPDLHKKVLDFFSLTTTPENIASRLEALLCCLPSIPLPGQLNYENIFRIAVVEFMDAHNFCVSRVKRSCVHFLTPAGQIIPFETYNLFYRNGKIDEIRKRLAATPVQTLQGV
jgi:7,8-dihydro-6-hydroxymethylpterin dimethyltransferase